MIRRGNVSDAVGVAKIQVGSWHEAYKGLMPDEYLAAFTVDKRTPVWRELLVDGTTLVEHVDDDIVGFCSIGPARDDDLDNSVVGEIFALYVDPSQWRGGIGTRLCAAGLEWLAEHGYKSASLWVLERNTVGRRFYEKYGFKPDGAEEPYHAGQETLNELRFAIDL